jgi:RimJ/RimL family protein N-acetyltransferase
MTIQYATISFAQSYCEAVDAVARERRFLGSTEGFLPEATFSFVRSVIENNQAQYFAIEQNRVVGWCDIIPKSYEGLRHVGVLGMGMLPAYRGKGLGTLLLHKTIEHARAISHLEKVELDVFESNSTAIALYRKFGFEVEGKRQNGRKLDGVYDSILLMSKFI